MPAILVPFIERRVRRALERRGAVTSMLRTSLGRVHVYDVPGRGALPTAVLLHGLSASAVQFAPMLARLRARTRRVVALDYPGHGFSDDPATTLTPERLLEATRELLDAVVGEEPAVLVGNSLGGAVAVDYAIARRDDLRRRLAALVLLSPGGAAFSDREWDDVRDAFAVTSRRRAIAFMNRVHHETPLVARLVAHELPALMRRRGVRELVATAKDRVLPGEELRALTVPILMWWGRSERLLPSSHLAWWRAHLPAHAVVEQPDGIGHCPHLDAPGVVAERIASFVAAAS